LIRRILGEEVVGRGGGKRGEGKGRRVVMLILSTPGFAIDKVGARTGSERRKEKRKGRDSTRAA